MTTQSRNPRWTFNTVLSIATTFGLWLTQAQFTHAVPLTDVTDTNTTSLVEPRAGPDFTWSSITPSPKIVWHPCYDTFECARLQVPLDYLNTNKTSADTAAIALIKYPSAPGFPEYSKKWGGPILLNPGGPGGSGVDFVLASGPSLGKVAGPQFSFIGFDPRGVGNTRPLAECFDSVADRLSWHIRTDRMAGANPVETWVKQNHMERICTQSAGSQKRRDSFKYMGAASVSRDMLEINEAIWDLAKPGVRRKGVQFWGYSYGSVLGISFATLFPKKVERMVLDGIVDVHDYFSHTALKYYVDTEDVLASFYTFCSKAGPQKCQFHTGTKPSHIRARLDSLLEALRKQPIGYLISSASDELPSSGQPELLTYYDIKNALFASVYDPINAFEGTATMLYQLETFQKTGDFILPVPLPVGVPLTCNKTEDNITNQILVPWEAYKAIFCGDATPKTKFSLSDYQKKLGQLKEQTPTFYDLAAPDLLTCTGWKVQSKWKVNYPKEDRSAQGNGPEGAAPILFLSNTDDPVTPLINAYSMAKLFPKNGAFVGVQEGEGHCTASVPSECMSRQIARYFAEGKVAKTESERFCAREVAPFLGLLSSKDKRDENESREILEALANIGHAVNKYNTHLGLRKTFK